ncbi:hypothetical protein CO731_04967 [Aminobacter sp. MSH1]|nr:hypothetical protein CO731_04967 [Aminobacter sp. MSH1]
MWLELTDTSGNRIAVNFDNIIRMHRSENTTSLWTNVAQGDNWLVFNVEETVENILAALRSRGA